MAPKLAGISEIHPRSQVGDSLRICSGPSSERKCEWTGYRYGLAYPGLAVLRHTRRTPVVVASRDSFSRTIAAVRLSTGCVARCIGSVGHSGIGLAEAPSHPDGGTGAHCCGRGINAAKHAGGADCGEVGSGGEHPISLAPDRYDSYANR